MELAATLNSQIVQNQVREVEINPNYWYPVSWAKDLKLGQVMPVQVWNQAIALYRDNTGNVHALEDACPHKGVELHMGEVQGENLVCPYHGWQFNSQGECVSIPYFPPEQKLPCANARTYPALEKYGVIWVFPGDPQLADASDLPDIPEYDDPDWLVVPIPARFKAHFSICNENTMDVFHGFLHRQLNGWFDPVLLSLERTEREVKARYKVSYQGQLSKFLRLSNDKERVTTRTITVHYRYPHYFNSLEGVSKMHLLRLPVSPYETRSFTLLFIKMRLPQWLVNSLKPVLAKVVWKLLFKRFLDQDVEMIESEQQTYLKNRQRRYVEVK
ncbi:MAG: aromatic ring-hydroxylating dioxygenase subunit alpha, partial [Kamptonema sp. SIO4C4]|nr:aromatic ring-hydroxylating dioxygenase subunit alpha [Kamptonema sp. SIO4C4]